MVDKEEDSDKRARSASPAVKSRAVVKYTAVQWPRFLRLQHNTDLKRPPSQAWLSGAPPDEYGLRRRSSHKPAFSSFRMADMFPDCVGEVDVVSGAECIKSLLKLPYQPDGNISMIVHRVENTLLLDEFDIYCHLMKSEWSWMRNFFYENVVKSLRGKERVPLPIQHQKQEQQQQQQRSLVAKFLYHSLQAGGDPHVPHQEEEPLNDHTYNRNVVWTFEDIQMLIGSDMPIFGGEDRPCVSLRLRDASRPISVLTGIDYWLDNLMCNVPEVIMCYHLDGIVQKYEPIKTEDLPYLEHSKFSPKVIRNVAQNILSFLKSNATKAGHTYWLFKDADDEVVKLYDLSTLCGKDSDSATKDGNPFTVPVGMLLYRVACNMKAPCQAGHMQVLLENCVKLLPVQDHAEVTASAHYMLAELHVPKDTNPQKTNFTDATLGECPCGSTATCRRREEDSSYHNTPYSPMEGGVAVRSLSVAREPQHCTGPRVSPTLHQTETERCLSALHHVSQALAALRNTSKQTQDKQKYDEGAAQKADSPKEDVPKMARPFQPIPMSYQSLSESNSECKLAKPNQPIPLGFTNKENTVEAVKPEKPARKRRKNKKKHFTEAEMDPITRDVRQKGSGVVLRKDFLPTWHEDDRIDDAVWKTHLKCLLYEKASLVYAILAEKNFSDCEYGISFKYIGLALECCNVARGFGSSGNIERGLLSRAGDVMFAFAKNWSKFTDKFSKQQGHRTELEISITEHVARETELLELSTKGAELCMPSDDEAAMLRSVELFTRALQLPNLAEHHRQELRRRTASMHNELGVKYMYMAQEHYNKFCSEEESLTEKKKGRREPLFEQYSKKSQSYLAESARVFEQVGDTLNLALLHCNRGRYMRFRAHCNVNTHSVEQKHLYGVAMQHYADALSLLGQQQQQQHQQQCDGVMELIRWELSSALFTQACLTQDYATHPDPYIAGTGAAEALRLALRNCPLTGGPRQCLYQFRAGLLHHRLASLYHNQYRDLSIAAAKRKPFVSLSKLNYELSVQLFLALEDTVMFLTVQMEHVALMEYQANNCVGLKLKSLQTALELLQACEPIIKIIAEKEHAPNTTQDEQTKSNVRPQQTNSQRESDSKDVDESRREENECNNEKDEVVKEQAQKEKSGSSYSSEYNLMCLFERRLQFVLKSLIQLSLLKQSGVSKKEGDRMSGLYKGMYALTLRLDKHEEAQCRLLAQQLHQLLVDVKQLSKLNNA